MPNKYKQREKSRALWVCAGPAPEGRRRLHLTYDLKGEREFTEVKGKSVPESRQQVQKALRHNCSMAQLRG